MVSLFWLYTNAQSAGERPCNYILTLAWSVKTESSSCWWSFGSTCVYVCVCVHTREYIL